jgi:hypothetical protein
LAQNRRLAHREIQRRIVTDDAWASLEPPGSYSGPEVGFGEVGSFYAEFAYFRKMTDRRSEKELGPKLALMGHLPATPRTALR